MKLIRVIQSKIVKKDNKYQVQSEKGRNLGTYDTKEKAEKRLKQVEMFKHMKSKLFTFDELNSWYENELQKQGFPSDEELHKEYDEYVKKIEQINNSQNANLHEDPVSFESYKESRIRNFSNKNVGDKPTPRKWHLDDEWINTDDDPIEEPKDVEL